ncbi:MAG: choice-of-anchor tandem repeat GloVer-containing protein [Candidatus Sulfotelmatobacter sp.]
MSTQNFRHGGRLAIRVAIAAVFFAFTFAGGAVAHAQATETIIYSFTGTTGQTPTAGLVSDAAGNLYGTTYNGGVNGDGALFELSPVAGGGWTYQLLHSFNRHVDGGFPSGTLIFDVAGNLYGTLSTLGPVGSGAAFEFSPAAGRTWVETVLHHFGVGKDGAIVPAGLTLDAAGNLYGTTEEGGEYGFGTVFELSSQGGGSWKEKILHNFNKNGKDGINPISSVAVDAAGNVYGTTQRGGSKNGGGIVFELSPTPVGAWTEKLLLTFEYGGKSPYFPRAGMIFDAAGNLYGTTFSGGLYAYGTVFELSPSAGGGWSAHLLYSFNPSGDSGDQPEANLIVDSAGNLYGTTNRGGVNGVGTVFELSPQGDGSWTETTLHAFSEGTGDGYQSVGSLVRDAAGNLYGTTSYGGATGRGIIFEVTP